MGRQRSPGRQLLPGLYAAPFARTRCSSLSMAASRLSKASSPLRWEWTARRISSICASSEPSPRWATSSLLLLSSSSCRSMVIGFMRFIDRMTKLTMETGTLRSRQLGRRLAMGPTEISASQSTSGGSSRRKAMVSLPRNTSHQADAGARTLIYLMATWPSVGMQCEPVICISNANGLPMYCRFARIVRCCDALVCLSCRACASAVARRSSFCVLSA
mmetsp:Transcript_42441/g.105684  ORF Transcript_42441/g.105684 Transcript_42441/m.105684 type:complete len:217 (+) Transcript_42441:320-970(+)